MAQPEITIRTTNPDGASADIASLCRSITWSGDYRNAARTLSFSPITSADDTHLPAAPTELGGSVQFSVDGTLLMDAYSLTRSRDSLGTTIDVIAYDRGIYLTRNNKTLAVNNQTPEAVTASLASEFGIQTGSIAATGVKLKRNFIGVSLYKIIMTLYSLAAEQTSKKYAIRFSGAALEVVEVKQSSTSIRLKPGSNLLSLNAKEDASKIINSVAIYDDEYKQTGIQQDAASAALYGMMQQAVKASQHDDPVAYTGFTLSESKSCKEEFTMFYGKKWTIDSIPTGFVQRSGTEEYTVRFERENASLDQIEAINWERPEIASLVDETCPLPRGGFDVAGITYNHSERTFDVTLRLKAEFFGDVSAYAAELAEKTAAFNEQEQTIAELGDDLIAAERDAREKAAQIEAKDAKISEQSAQLSEKDSRIATLQQELAEADELAISLYEAQEQAAVETEKEDA